MNKNETNKTLIISAFPGCGKSYCAKNEADKFNGVLDLESSPFSHTSAGTPIQEFPGNYVKKIKEAYESGKYEVIFVSSHKAVRQALEKEGLPFVLVYPRVFEKKDYMERYKKRGSSKHFMAKLDSCWEEWVEECREAEYPIRIELPYFSCKFLNKEVIELIKIMEF